MSCNKSKEERTLSSQVNYGQMANNKEEKMKRSTNFPRGRPRSSLLSVLVAFTVLIAFGAVFSSDCKDVDGSLEQALGLDDMVSKPSYPVTKVNKIESDIKCLSDNIDNSKNDVVAGIDFGNTTDNFGGFPFAMLGLFAPAFAISRKRKSFTFAMKNHTREMYSIGAVLLAALLGVIMLASGFATAVSLTPLIAIGGTILLMTAKKPEPALAFAMSTSHEEADVNSNLAGLSEFDIRRVRICIRGFKIAKRRGPEEVEKEKLQFLELCSSEVVNIAFEEVFGKK